MLVDEKSVTKTPNTNPMIYENVKVWAAQGKHFPATNARIKELEYEQKSKYIPIQRPLNIINLIPDYELVTKDNLVATLPSWGQYFEVSLKIWVESFSGNKDGWSELLRFTASEKDNWNEWKAGARIPAIFVNSAGYIHVASQVGTNGNYVKNVNIKLKTWTKVQIKQYPDENGKVILHLYFRKI